MKLQKKLDKTGCIVPIDIVKFHKTHWHLFHGNSDYCNVVMSLLAHH